MFLGFGVLAVMAVLSAEPTPATAAAGPVRPKIAVMEIRPNDDLSRQQVGPLQEVVLGELSRTDRFDLIGKSDIEAMLGLERQRQLLGCGDEASSCLAELGGALGVDYLITGSLARIEKTHRLDLKLIDARANRVVARDFANAKSEGDVMAQTERIVAGFLKYIPDHRPKPVAAAPAAQAPVPWVGIGTTAAGGMLALIGGIATVASTAHFNANRTTLRADEGLELERRANLGLWGVGLGAAVTGAGLWLLLGQKPPATLAFATGPEGWTVAVSGSFR